MSPVPDLYKSRPMDLRLDARIFIIVNCNSKLTLIERFSVVLMHFYKSNDTLILSKKNFKKERKKSKLILELGLSPLASQSQIRVILSKLSLKLIK